MTELQGTEESEREISGRTVVLIFALEITICPRVSSKVPIATAGKVLLLDNSELCCWRLKISNRITYAHHPSRLCITLLKLMNGDFVPVQTLFD